MAMSKLRKRLQDKLRRKYKWQTNTNYNRGTMLIKPDALQGRVRGELRWTTDLSIDLDDFRFMRGRLPITITLTKYEPLPDGTFQELACLGGFLSFEELELVYNIAKEKFGEIRKGENKND